MYSLARPGGTHCSSASLPNPLLELSAGNPNAGFVVSLITSRTVLLYSGIVRRRSGARPGVIAFWSAQRAVTLPPEPPVPEEPAVVPPAPGMPAAAPPTAPLPPLD